MRRFSHGLKESAADPALPMLEAALDPRHAARCFARECPPMARAPAIVRVQVMRHRPGRRCLIRYGLADGTAVIGKMTARGVHKRGLAVQTRLHAAGFGGSAADGIAVPEPLGAVPSLGLWLQREVPGRPLQALLGEADAARGCVRAAQALVKLHRLPAGTAAVWTIADELAVLEARLGGLAASRADLAARARRLLAACHEAAALLPEATARGIHRDFHPEQLLIAGDLIHLVDLDLHALGDPALDAGNFIAHLIEAAIREKGQADAHGPLVDAFRQRFLALSPAVAPKAVAIHSFLSLARLAQISTAMPERRHATEAILATAEAMAPDGFRRAASSCA